MSENLTLLLTDIVDSTRLHDALGDDPMARWWAEHDRTARSLMQTWRGRELGRSDGFLVLFDKTGDAVEFALDYHASLTHQQPPVKARVGVHFGPVRLRHNHADDVARGATPYDIDGLALPVAARVMEAALGGQTLLSVDALQALGATGHRVVSHGHWRLKGLAEPLELLEVGRQDAPFMPPIDVVKAYRVTRVGEDWVSARELPHTLPAERDRFIGRGELLQRLAGLIDDGYRLVTLLGIGGIGKTRLALHYARGWLGDHPGGAWFCDLSAARGVDGIAHAVAHGLELPLGKGDPVAQLAQAIAGRGRCLVILDNFEQVARHADETLGHWVDRAPQAKFIVTTRQVLGMVGEAVLSVTPLPSGEAAELFSRRAASARVGYVPDANDVNAIGQLVRVLDGLPLAIELAAARVRVMSPHTLMARMRDRFDLIGMRARRQDRHATLWATFDWSWELLDDHERAALAELSVFEGGFTLEAAAAVLAALAGTARAVIDVVQGLIDKSFVRQVDENRYDLLETVREYAGQHLISEGSFPGSGPRSAAATLARHWQYFAALDERAAIAHRCVETGNLVAACRAACGAADTASAAACLATAWSSLRLTGPYRVAVELAESVAALSNLADRERALVHWVAGDALELQGEVEAARLELQRGLVCAGRAQERRVTARLLIALGNRQTLDGELEAAQTNLQESLQLAMDLRDADLQMRALNALGLLSDHQSRWTQAQGFYEAALVVARTLGDRRMEGGLLGNLGGVHYDMGDLPTAQSHYELALRLANEMGDRRWEGNARCNLGLLHQELGRSAEARAQFETALTMARQVGHVRLEYTVLCNLGILLSGEGRLVEAGEHFDQAVGAAAACSDVRAEGQFRGYLALNQARRGLLDDARASLVIGERLLVTMSDALSHALLLCDRAEVEVIGQCTAVAQHSFDEASRIAEALGCRSDSELCRRLEALGWKLAEGA
jgi:predicted ATPase/class 3 adenylate cyclase